MARRVLAALALTTLVAGCGAAPGAQGRRGQEGVATPAATVAAKPDISKAGDVTLTVWDQEVRGGQNDGDRGAQQAVHGEVPERQDRAHREVLRGPAQDGQARGLGPERAGRRARPTRAARIMGEMVKAGCSARSPTTRRSTAGTTATRRRCWTLNTFSPDGKEFGSRRPVRALADRRDRRRLLQQGQGPDAAEDARRVRGLAAEGQGRGRDADHVRQPREVAGHPQLRVRARADRRQAGDPRLRVRQGRRVVRQPAVHRRRHEDQGLGRQGLLQQELQRHRLRPGVASVREGQEPVPDRRHVGDGRPGRSRWATRSASC